jgi:hypothetical protein
MANEDWQRSETADVLWGARKLVLAVTDGIDQLMDVIDPIGCYRQGVDRYGEPLERESDVYTTLDFLFMWEGKLRRANSALYEVADRLKEVGDGVPADLPDTEGR